MHTCQPLDLENQEDSTSLVCVENKNGRKSGGLASMFTYEVLIQATITNIKNSPPLKQEIDKFFALPFHYK